MAQQHSGPPRVPLFINEQTHEFHPKWQEFFQQFLTKAETQTDASSVSNPPTQAEVNAIVTVINALIDKLQAAGLME